MSRPKSNRDHGWFRRQVEKNGLFVAQGSPKVTQAAISNGSTVSYVPQHGIRLFGFPTIEKRDQFVERHHRDGVVAAVEWGE